MRSTDLFLSLGLLCIMYVDSVLYFLSLGLIYVTLYDVMFVQFVRDTWVCGESWLVNDL